MNRVTSVLLAIGLAALAVLAAPSAHASCSDNLLNGTETGVDCGGSSCLACNGTTCSSNAQCASGGCIDGTCSVLYTVATSSGSATTIQHATTSVVIDPQLTVVGSGTITGARVTVINYTNGEDVLAYPAGTAIPGITGSFDTSKGYLTLTGTNKTIAEYEAALRTVTYRRTTTDPTDFATRIIAFSIGDTGVALSTNGHFYRYVGTALSWYDANTAATAARYFGLRGYLATVTSPTENAFIGARLNSSGWIGASDETTPNTWRWITGPEGLEPGGGRHFFAQVGTGGSPTIGYRVGSTSLTTCTVNSECESEICNGTNCLNYDNWQRNSTSPFAYREPNNSGGLETHGHFNSTGANWNDIKPVNPNPTVNGYIIEFGGLPNDPAVVLQDTKNVRIIPTTCTNNLVDAGETDKDCGGVCGTCGTGKICALDSDCASAQCEGNLCQAPSCSDGLQNGSETAVDCGGTCALDCAPGQGCNANSDCSSGKCLSNFCQVASCTDSVKNASETDVDCGGSCTADCTNGSACLVNADCQSGICNASGICQSAQCNDGTKNGTETDTDCGGNACGPCAATKACTVANDCQSQKCTGLVCQAPTCSDIVRNGSETDVDCGGSCVTDCGLGKGCAAGSDCTTGVCNNGTCQAGTCSDGVKNGSELGVDCGGSCGGACNTGEGCTGNATCLSGVCSGSICQAPSCSDAIKNGSETATDCGGYCGATCGTGIACGANGDCTSRHCVSNQCVVATCNDTIKNQNESDIDCGGTCTTDCAIGRSCNQHNDCQTSVCSSNNVCVAQSCSDGQQNQSESDIDCGGPCADCGPGLHCGNAGDCTSGVCSGTFCQAPSCGDLVQNGSETGLDCGGACPNHCDDGGGCTGPNDCRSGVCANSVCAPGTCLDGVKNQDEPATDCGGTTCPACLDGQACDLGGDCTSGVCTSHICQAARCDDGVQNQGESTIDCGGPACPGQCAIGDDCNVDADCMSGRCEGTCQPSDLTCHNDALDDDESDVDCGGPCVDCAYGDTCDGDGDCATGHCVIGLCGCPDGSALAGDGETCLAAGECDPQGPICSLGTDLVFYGIVSNASGPYGSIRCTRSALGDVTCATNPDGTLAVSATLWCEQ